jgi:gamma-glutamyltranspeptidase/glutathione hydrolase
MAPAIALARDGFEVETISRIHCRAPHAAGALALIRQFSCGPTARCGAGRPAGAARPCRHARAIAQRGHARSTSPIADKLAAIQAAGGIMTVDDLRNYRAHLRRPVRGRYRGHEIISMPPSSSGGVVLIEMLNILEGYKLAEQDDASRLHLMIEAMRRAYADRAAYLGDPAVVSAPLTRLMSKRYAAQLRRSIDPARATPSREIRDDILLPREGDNTTHFSVIDATASASPAPHAQFQLRRGWWRKAPACCSTMSSTISPRSRMRRMPSG